MKKMFLTISNLHPPSHYLISKYLPTVIPVSYYSQKKSCSVLGLSCCKDQNWRKVKQIDWGRWEQWYCFLSNSILFSIPLKFDHGSPSFPMLPPSLNLHFSSGSMYKCCSAQFLFSFPRFVIVSLLPCANSSPLF